MLVCRIFQSVFDVGPDQITSTLDVTRCRGCTMFRCLRTNTDMESEDFVVNYVEKKSVYEKATATQIMF